MKSSQLPEKLWPVLKGLVGAIVAVTLLGWFFLRDVETSRPWISHAQFARGEVLSVAHTRGTGGTAFVYVRATSNAPWRNIASWFYVTTDENSPIDAYLMLSRDGNLLCDGVKLSEVQWAFDFSSQKTLRRKTDTLPQIAAFDPQLKRLIARHGSLVPLKCQTYRASPWKWADTQAKELMQEQASEDDT